MECTSFTVKNFSGHKNPVNKIYLYKSDNKIEIEIDRYKILLSKKSAKQFAERIIELTK